MSKAISKGTLKWILLAVVVAAVALFGYLYWKAKRSELPAGFASGNGRIEAKLVDVAVKEPLRVKEILVDEGYLVEPNQVLVLMDTMTLEAQRLEAKAKVAAAQETVAMAKAGIVTAKSEIELAKIELERSRRLLAESAGSQREYDFRKTKLETTSALLDEEQAKLKAAKEEVDVAKANVEVIQTRIDDATLRSPVHGRVLYRLAEVGEVLGAGGKALTLVNLNDVYMEIFLPADEASRLKIGAEGRVTVDYLPGRAVAGYVSFVSPEAQFTPKQVETATERAKLMFRVKIQVPEEFVSAYIQYIKTGVRGVGYVKVDPSAVWPAWLQNLIELPPEKAGGATPANERRKEVP
jgi:HlyD family secretion protein